MSLSYSDLLLFSCVSTLAINYALLRIPGWHRPWLFWPVQLINLAAGTWLLVASRNGWPPTPLPCWTKTSRCWR